MSRFLLQDNPVVTSLDLEDNGIFADGAKYIAEMLHKNSSIIDLVSRQYY